MALLVAALWRVRNRSNRASAACPPRIGGVHLFTPTAPPGGSSLGGSLATQLVVLAAHGGSSPPPPGEALIVPEPPSANVVAIDDTRSCATTVCSNAPRSKQLSPCRAIAKTRPSVGFSGINNSCGCYICLLCNSPWFASNKITLLYDANSSSCNVSGAQYMFFFAATTFGSHTVPTALVLEPTWRCSCASNPTTVHTPNTTKNTTPAPMLDSLAVSEANAATGQRERRDGTTKQLSVSKLRNRSIRQPRLVGGWVSGWVDGVFVLVLVASVSLVTTPATWAGVFFSPAYPY